MNSYQIAIGSRHYTVLIDADSIKVNGEPVNLSDVLLTGQTLSFLENGNFHRAVFDKGDEKSFVYFNGREAKVSIETERDRLLRESLRSVKTDKQHAEIRAAMPGLVVKIHALPGKPVMKGDSILILEAMKMENEVRAPVDGVIREIRAVERGSVEKGDVLAIIE